MTNLILTNCNLPALIDDEDFAACSQRTWSVDSGGYPTTHILCGHKYRKTKLHSFVLGIGVRESSKRVDHIDRNKLNNQKSNLRLVGASENAYNSVLPKGNNKYKGVTWHKGLKCFRARFRHNNKDINVGNFNTEEQAVAEYNRRITIVKGSKAVLITLIP